MSRALHLHLLDVHPDNSTLRLGHRVLTDGLGIALALLVMVGSVSLAWGAATLVAGGQHFSCAVRPDSTVACWGRNHKGQLGNGTTISSSTPVTVVGLSNVVAIAAGRFHACAVLADGTANCWGQNFSGQLGNGTNDSSYTPVSVSGLTGAVAIGAGSYFTCALRSTGTVRCWGLNLDGNLGNGTTTSSNIPVAVSGLTGATHI